jgi:hypothetical protein
MNFEMKKFDFLPSTGFKLLSQMKGIVSTRPGRQES